MFLFGCSTNNNGVTTVVPAAPTNLTGTATSGTQINLSWTDNATNETGYKIQRKTGNGSFTDAGSTGTDISTFSDLGLTNNTTYTYRVYAFNSAGNSLQYSNEVTVITNTVSQTYSYTPGPIVTDINGNIYQSITTSCGQTWTKKNLNVSRYRNGDAIPQVTDATQWQNLTTGAWCWYNNDSANYSYYGKLYNWYAVNDSRGLAPQGWHIPTDIEWNNIVICIDPLADIVCSGCSQSSTAGGAMKETGTTYWLSPNISGNNNSGFAGLPGGSRNSSGFFTSVGVSGIWWSCSELSTSNSWQRVLTYTSADVLRNYINKAFGNAVRIVKD